MLHYVIIIMAFTSQARAVSPASTLLFGFLFLPLPARIAAAPDVLWEVLRVLHWWLPYMYIFFNAPFLVVGWEFSLVHSYQSLIELLRLSSDHSLFLLGVVD